LGLAIQIASEDSAVFHGFATPLERLVAVTIESIVL
jgi:hypothetical protein